MTVITTMGKRAFVLATVLAASSCADGPTGRDGDDQRPGNPGPGATDAPAWKDPALPKQTKPRNVVYPSQRGVSPPLAEVLARPAGAPPVPGAEAWSPKLPAFAAGSSPRSSDLGVAASTPLSRAKGPRHEVELSGGSVNVYDSSGAALLRGAGASPWAGFGGACELYHDGESDVVYDALADRWVISRFSGSVEGQQCFAVSQTSDPLGAYYLYEYRLTPGAVGNYAKLGVWPDGYRLTFNEFTGDFKAASVVVADREALLAGKAAAFVRFDASDPARAETYFALRPAGLDGRTAPPAGAPGFIVQAFDDELWSKKPGAGDSYKIWSTRVDWTDPGAATLTGPLSVGASEFEAGVGPFSSELSYRNYGNYDALVVRHATDAGARWVELRNPATAPELRALSGEPGGSVVLPQGSFVGLVSGPNGPLAGATVHAGSFSAVTGADGRYLLAVPAGALDLRATAYGYAPKTAPGAAVAEGSEASVDFVLEPAADVLVSGFAYDDTKASWPLYTRIEFTAAGGPPVVAYTDPETGYYEALLPSGTTFNATVHSLLAGYDDEVRPITPGDGPVAANFGLEISGTCSAPGYEVRPSSLLVEAFEGADFPPRGWAIAHQTTGCGAAGPPQWAGNDPGARGNRTGATGKFAIADSDKCGPGSTTRTQLTTPVIDLSAVGPGESVSISFNQDLFTLPGTLATVEAWDGATWVPVSTQTVDSRAKRVAFGTTASNGRADARFRFTYVGTWDWWWEIDDVAIDLNVCSFAPGGLALGNVFDLNTGLGINGATVDLGNGATATAFATPNDPAQADGFYVGYVPGRTNLVASADGYGSVTRDFIPQIYGARRADFELGSGLIVVEPSTLNIRVPIEGTGGATLTVRNDGSAPATVSLKELDTPAASLSFARLRQTPGRTVEAKQATARNARGLPPAVRPAAGPQRVLAAGNVVRAFAAGVGPWGIGFDSGSNSAWVGNVGGLSGDDRLHHFNFDGTPTGESISFASYASVFAADLAYDSTTGKLWHLNVGGGDCIHEVDPATQTVTGNTICPAFGISQRGLAYDAGSDTFYAGSWNDTSIHQFTRTGTILRSVNVGLDVSGLAYNAATGHLFVLANVDLGAPDLHVLNAADLTSIGSARITQNGAPAMVGFAQAGIELDCDGNLWAVDQTGNRVVVVESGETGSCAGGGVDVPWLSEDPNEFTLAPGQSIDVAVNVDATTITPGLRQAQLIVDTDTPYDVPNVAVNATVAFDDVPETHYADPYIHGLAGVGISFGCGAHDFCPGLGLTRGALAVWALRSINGADFDPPPPTGLPFDDVSPESFAADFIEEYARQGFIEPCGPGLYCPNDTFNRELAAVYVLRALSGPDFVPPPAEGLFADVPVTHPFAAWIDELGRRGIATTCGGNNFCPSIRTTRAEMSIFLVKGFDFPNLAP